MGGRSWTEYGVKGSGVRHGEWVTMVETLPGQETDRAANEELVKRDRAWQKACGREPDAELVIRTHTVSEWQVEAKEAER